MKTIKNKQANFFADGLLFSRCPGLIEDAGFKGVNVHSVEALPIVGASNDGSGTKQVGFVMASKYNTSYKLC